MPKWNTVSAKCRESEIRTMRAAARGLDMTLSKFVRKASLAVAKQRLSEARELQPLETLQREAKEAK